MTLEEINLDKVKNIKPTHKRIGEIQCFDCPPSVDEIRKRAPIGSSYFFVKDLGDRRGMDGRYTVYIYGKKSKFPTHPSLIGVPFIYGNIQVESWADAVK